MHGGYLYVLKLLILLSLVLSGSISASTNYKFNHIDKSLVSKNLQLTKKETQIVQNFNTIFKLAQKGIYNSKSTKRLNTRIKKNKTFEKYYLWTNTFIKIQNAKRLTTIKKLCRKLGNTKYTDHVLSYLTKNTTTLCFNKYLDVLSKNSRNSLTFHNNELVFFKQHLTFLLKYQNRDKLNNVLRSVAKNKYKSRSFSKVITQHLINTSATPSTSLISNLHISPTLTGYLQSLDLHKRGTQRTFYREFKKKMKYTLDFADKNPKSEKIKMIAKDTLNYFNSTLAYQNKELVFKSLLSLGKSFTRRNQFELARECFNRLLIENTRLRKKVIFEYFWTYAVQGEYEDALEIVIDKFAPNLELIKSDSKLHFWIGLAHFEQGNTKTAKRIFKDLVKTNPLSYYAILSAKKLSEDLNEKTEDIYLGLLNGGKTLPNTRDIASSEIDYRWLKRVIGWSLVNNDRFLNLELNNTKMNKSGQDLQNHLMSAAYMLGTKKDYLESFKVIYRNVENKNLNINKDALKILFPQPYFNQIKSRTKDFDPVIALSLIRQESGFNRHAKSIVGARGLMQLMPNTAKRFKRRVKTRQLYNAKLNIQIGTKYFKKLLSRYDQNLVYSLAAYNAGEGRVDEWQEQYLTSKSILKNIENIPFLETRKYVKLIFRNIFFYKMLFKQDHSDSESFNEIYDINLGFNN